MLLPRVDIEFRDRTRASACWKRLSAVLPDSSLAQIEKVLSSVADPDCALLLTETFVERQREAFDRLAASPTGLRALETVFSHSRFLSDELQQHPEWLDHWLDSGLLYRALGYDEFYEQLEAAVGAGLPAAIQFAQFKRRHLLRILLRDVLGLSTLAETTAELSSLADVILDVSYKRIRADLAARYGKPQSEQGECGFSVLALGKLGGRELNYSSDIDLMFVFGGPGDTDGETSISNKEFFKKVANQYTELLSTFTAEGFCYRVDLRLRPDGSLGEICTSLDGAKAYYGNRARDWELQMLIKARVAAGEKGPGRKLLEFVEPLIYSTTLDFSAVEAVSEVRERIHEKLQARRSGGRSELDVKLTRGGIRDIEFLVQCLQRLHGGREPWVRHGGTQLALFRLRDKDLLSPSEYSRLSSAYEFLRHLEHRLQYAEDRQTHTLPRDAEQMELLARRMPESEIGPEPSAENLLRRLNHHLEEVHEIYERVIHAQKPVYYTSLVPAQVGVKDIDIDLDHTADPPAKMPSNLVRFLDQKAPDLGALLSQRELKRGAHAFELFLEKILPQQEHLDLLNDDAELAARLIEVFEHSPFFSEELLRTPELLKEFATHGVRPRIRERDIESPREMRSYFRHEMFRIQVESFCLATPIFQTLERTSDLVDLIIRVAYRIAIEQVVSTKPPVTPGYQIDDQLMVIALGRLGMREFDLGSDADLVFVLPDSEKHELIFWTRVTERLIDLLTAYTGEGVMFAVDTRLRPNGREGDLLQLESGYREYFDKRAEAWEGITYMKSRAVAGDMKRGITFLNQLQEIDWRRYGQSGRSQKDLRRIRQRLEKEQGPDNPLKSGTGGYYDIDFGLMYLRLKGAGIFFPVLNTPARIDVLEKMGHLERADAAFLRDAATFYRAVDHGLRLMSGHAKGSLPRSPSQLQLLSELAARWTPDHLHDQPLATELAQIQNRSREYFERLFG